MEGDGQFEIRVGEGWRWTNGRASVSPSFSFNGLFLERVSNHLPTSTRTASMDVAYSLKPIC